MQRRIVAALAGITLWCGAGLNQASAQFGTLGQPPQRRPAISPYINLGQGGNAFNYYGLVQPQMQAQRNIAQLQQGMQLLNPDGSARSPLLQQTQAAAITSLRTGNPALFNYTAQYFPQNPYMGTMVMGMGMMPMGGGLGGFGVGQNTNFPGGFMPGQTGGQTFFGGAFNTGGMGMGFRR